MKNLQLMFDRTAIGLSFLCAFHCLALPLAIVLLPSLASLPLQNEAYHMWMLAAVIPTSAYALTLGCKKHKRFQLLALGVVGVSCLLAAVFLAEAYGEVWEKTLTLLGAGIIASAHYRNFVLCKPANQCGCD